MFKKTKKKIVATIMFILVLLWIGTIGVIYASSYVEMTRHNYDMMRTHSQMYHLSPQKSKDFPYKVPLPDIHQKNQKAFMNTPMFMLTTFYTVAFSYDGEIIETINNKSEIHANAELEETAKKILSEGKTKGTKNDLLFLFTDKGGYYLVTFMDNTILNENALTLLRNTLISGCIMLVIFFFLSIFLAKKIIQPIEESYLRQKQFISDAGHELKTPVSVIGANVDILQREVGNNPWLNNIQYENERMSGLIKQLLELARTQALTPSMSQLDFSRLCEGELLPFESIAFEKDILMQAKMDKNIIVNGNETQLKQLISILIDNAISHSHAKDMISVILTREHNIAKLSVINPGKEIPKDQRKLLFERFYRMDETRNSNSGHYGLGLAIASSIVTSHKGKIQVTCHDQLIEFQVFIPILP